MKILDALSGSDDKSYDTPQDRERAAKELTEKCGYAAAALAMIPIPGTELVAVMPLHVGMVVGIGNIYGVQMTRDSANTLVLRIGATVGLSLVGSTLAVSAAKLVSFGLLGGIIGAPFMYASTQAIGAVARVYFQSEGELSDDELKSVYQENLKRAKKAFDPTRAKSPEAQDLAQAAAKESQEEPELAAAAAAPVEEDPIARLEKLKGLLDKGLIDADEYDTVKKRILESI
jgi:uncharacterized protein (DUF697 family)